MDLEKIATSAIVSEISKTDTLSGFISEGDKEPCWDGNIYIHEDLKHSKKNIKRVPTQIKGKAVNVDKVKDSISYPISYDDLNAYLQDGGVLFFVVYIHKTNGDVLQVYYTALIPIRIMEMFKQKKKTYSVLFDKFPEDNEKKLEIVLDVYSNSRRQKSYAGVKLPTVEELSDKGILESLSFHITNVGEKAFVGSVPRIMEGKSLTIYANVKGNPIGIPVEYHQNISHVMTYQDFEEQISANGIVFFDTYRVVFTSTSKILLIGNCISFTYPLPVLEGNEPIRITINLNQKATLKEQIRGLKFFLVIVRQGGYYKGSNYERIQFEKKWIDEKVSIFEERLKALEYLQTILNNMHVSKDMLFKEWNDEDDENLKLLIEAIGKKRPVKNTPQDLSKVYALKISNLTLGVVYVKHSDGQCYLYDYFGEHLIAMYNKEGSEIRVSQYGTMKSEDFLKYDNICLPIIIEDFKMLPVSANIINDANLLMLEMIKAYDQCKSMILLEFANQMNEWLTKYPELIDSVICVINHYQIVARQRELLVSEKEELRSIAEETEEMSYKAGALILLGDSKEVNRVLTSFDENQLDEFCNYPIYSLHKKNICVN